MGRVSVFLVFLLIVLTFNAYACVLPLQQTAEMDCASGTEEPVRDTCDAFLEMGPLSQLSTHHAASSFQLESALPVPLLSDTFVSRVLVTKPPRNPDTSIHPSVRTTVLRI
ncbi:MAG: hypothetical protein H8K04_05605 [Nitrospira sp.]